MTIAAPSLPPTFRNATVRRLGATGPFGLGGSGLGNLYRHVDNDTAQSVIDMAWERGIRYYDTAPYYGFGLSELRLGRCLYGRPRAEFVLSTKVGRLLSPCDPVQPRHGFYSPMPYEPVFDYTFDGVQRSVEASMARLGVDRIDILLMHDLGAMTHGDRAAHYFAQASDGGGFRAMESLRDQGIVGAIGLGVNEIPICAESLRRADLDVLMIAGRYTLIDHPEDDRFLETCTARGVGLIQAGVFNSGVLATGARQTGDAKYDYDPAPAHVLERVRRIEAICLDHGVPLAAAALQFAAGIPQAAAAVVGTATPARIDELIELTKRAITADLWKALAQRGLLPRAVPID